MITEITSDVRLEVMDYASSISEDMETQQEIYQDVMTCLNDIGRDDDLNGTNNLYTLLYSSESQTIKDIAEDRLFFEYEVTV